MHEVVFSTTANDDLGRLFDFILDQTRSAAVAEGYVQRIVAHCGKLADFPERGTSRPELRPGLRTLGFEGRATIAFVVENRTVTILRVLYAGRDLNRLIKG